jgi:two-component system NarL family response regulator
MTHEMQIRVLVADDHPIVLEGICSLIRAQPDMAVVGEASNAAHAIELYTSLRPDVAVLDVSMPGVSGIEATETICQQFSGARIVLLTIREGGYSVRRALQAGALAYILKESLRSDIIAAIRSVHAGQKYLPERVARSLADSLSSPDLSGRELQVLQLITEALSNREIASRLNIAEETVKVHVKSILSKLDVRDRAHAGIVAVRRGIISAES